MIQAVIIDDELHLREAIAQKINKFFKDEIVVIGESGSVKHATELINTLNPDLLLLDIELNDGTSFDVLNNIKIENFKIIFITGFNEHAIKAIKIGAIDYLLKPIDDTEFVKAIKKVVDTKNLHLKEQLEVAKNFYQTKKNKRIVLKTLEAYHIIEENNIMYCKSEGNYTTFYIKDKKPIMISKPLKKAVELLSENNFVRCHQSYLVNINYVEKILPDGYLVVENASIPVAGRRKDLVFKKLLNLK